MALFPPWVSPVELPVVLLSLLPVVLTVAVVLAVQEAPVVPEQPIAVVLGLAGPAEIVYTSSKVGAISKIVSEYGTLWEGQVRQMRFIPKPDQSAREEKAASETLCLHGQHIHKRPEINQMSFTLINSSPLTQC